MLRVAVFALLGVVLVGCEGVGVAPENLPPVAVLEVRIEGGEIVLDGTASHDPDGEIVALEYFDAGVVVGKATAIGGLAPVRTPVDKEEHAFKMKATDNGGAVTWSDPVVLDLTGSEAVGYWSSIGGDAAVDVSFFSSFADNERWLFDFLKARMDEGMNASTASMFVAPKITYSNSVVRDGFSADGRFADDEREFLSRFYLGNEFHIGYLQFKEMYAEYYLNTFGVDIANNFPSPPSIGLLEFPLANNPKINGVQAFGILHNRIVRGVSPFPVNEGSKDTVLFMDYETKEVPLAVWNGLSECADDGDNKPLSSFSFHTDPFVVLENYGSLDLNFMNPFPFHLRVWSKSRHTVTGGLEDDMGWYLESFDASESLRHYNILYVVGHMDISTFDDFDLGSVILPNQNFTLLSDSRVEYRDGKLLSALLIADTNGFSSNGNLNRIYGGNNKHTEKVIVEQLAFDTKRPETYVGFSDPTVMPILSVDDFGNMILVDGTTLNLTCFGSEPVLVDLSGWFARPVFER